MLIKIWIEDVKKIKKNATRVYFELKLAALSPSCCLRWKCESCNTVIPPEEVISQEAGFFHDCAGELKQLVLNEQSPIWEHECERYWGTPLELLWRHFDGWITKRSENIPLSVVSWRCNLCGKQFETLECGTTKNVSSHQCNDEGCEDLVQINSVELGNRDWSTIEIGESIINDYLQWLEMERAGKETYVDHSKSWGGIVFAVVAVVIFSAVIGVIGLGLLGIKLPALPFNLFDVQSVNAPVLGENRVETDFEREKRLMQEWVDAGNFPTREEVNYYKLKVPNDQYWEWSEKKGK